MRWAIVAKTNIPSVNEHVAEAIEYLQQNPDNEIFLHQEIAQHLRKAGGASYQELHTMADVFLVVGGDGTVLTVQQYTDKPVLAINGGTLGFLSVGDVTNTRAYLERFEKGDYWIEERVKMQVNYDGQEQPVAINEIALLSSQPASLLKLDISINKQQTPTFRGDGVIVATSTGSTGYAMSAGGPILHPLEKSLVVVPICPFHLTARPWLVPSYNEIHIEVEERYSRTEPAVLVIDGYHRITIEQGKTVTVTRSKQNANYIRFEHDFYERVSTMLR